jgi:hypothetical protein
MSDIDEESLVRHIRGATVVHKSPFSSIEVPSVVDSLSQEQCDRWVVPFYRVSFRSPEKELLDSLKNLYPEISLEMTRLLLTDYNWRPRLTGAFFAALKRFTTFEDQIGRLLLRSDLCYAGKFYCVALAEFNSPHGLEFLMTYLKHYLTRPELVYNQNDAIGAVAFLDVKNGTRHLGAIRPLWNQYVNSLQWKPDLDKNIAWFSEEMAALHQCRAHAEG